MLSMAIARRLAVLALVATLIVSGIAAMAAPASAAATVVTPTGTANVTRDGMTMLPFMKTMQEAGISVRFDSAAQAFYARVNGVDITVPVYDVYAVVGGRTVKMSRAPVVVQGVAYIAQDFIDGILSGSYLNWRWYDGWSRGRRVVSLDPGHTWTAPRDGLQFKLTYKSGNPEQIGIMVRNATSKDITIISPSGKTHEIVILRDGRKVWSSSDGKAYTMALQNVTFKAGETKTYWEDIPRLSSGAYTVRGYFTAVSSSRPVVTTTLSVRDRGYGSGYTSYDPLEYSLSFRQRSGSNPASLMLTVKNPTNSEVTFSGTQTYEFVIWGKDGSVTRKTLPAMSTRDFVQSVRPGALQQHFIYLRDLARGDYYAEGYVMQGTRVVRNIGGISFTIR